MKEIPEKYRNDLAIIRDTVNQINKDFNLDGFELKLSEIEQNTFDDLTIQLIPIINQLYKKDKTAFNNLLYRVDIPEKDFRKLLNENQNNFSENLAEMIIRREFQKVLMKRFFSK
jgi:hypothetical protein